MADLDCHLTALAFDAVSISKYACIATLTAQCIDIAFTSAEMTARAQSNAASTQGRRIVTCRLGMPSSRTQQQRAYMLRRFTS